jgi:hypothetical protein
MANKFKTGDRVRFVGAPDVGPQEYHNDYQQAFGVIGEIIQDDSGMFWPYTVKFPGTCNTEGTEELVCAQNELAPV